MVKVRGVAIRMHRNHKKDRHVRKAGQGKKNRQGKARQKKDDKTRNKTKEKRYRKARVTTRQETTEHKIKSETITR
jgi:hypothetical protein